MISETSWAKMEATPSAADAPLGPTGWYSQKPGHLLTLPTKPKLQHEALLRHKGSSSVPVMHSSGHWMPADLRTSRHREGKPPVFCTQMVVVRSQTGASPQIVQHVCM